MNTARGSGGVGLKAVAVATAALVALALAGCGGGDDESPDRRASGEAPLAWEGQTGDSFPNLGYRGVQIDFTSQFTDPENLAQMSIAAKAKALSDLVAPCPEWTGGTALREVPNGQRAVWRATDEILFDAVCTKENGTRESWKSQIRWPIAWGGEHEGYGTITFALLNPAARKPRFVIQGKDPGRNPCLSGWDDNPIDLAEGDSRTLADGQPFCKIEMVVTRLTDTRRYKRFTVVARPA